MSNHSFGCTLELKIICLTNDRFKYMPENSFWRNDLNIEIIEIRSTLLDSLAPLFDKEEAAKGNIF